MTATAAEIEARKASINRQLDELEREAAELDRWLEDWRARQRGFRCVRAKRKPAA